MNRPEHVLPSPVKAAPLPEVVNHTPWSAQYFQHVDAHGEAFHVVVCRIGYSLEGLGGGAEPQPLDPDEQTPLVEADEHEGEAGISPTIQESDFAPYKPLCDVLLADARAYVPEGRPMRRWSVGLGLGGMRKVLSVCGPRSWRTGLAGSWLDEPAPVTEVPLSYTLAFGGPSLWSERLAVEALADDDQADPAMRDQAARLLNDWPEHHAANPFGCGRLAHDAESTHAAASRICAGMRTHTSSPHAAPQIEVFERPFKGERDYPIVGYGPVGRWWAPRLARAGTHDSAWKARQWPLPPLDHDYRYWNCAPDDQQLPYPHGGEPVTLVNLTPGGGTVRFALPRQDLRLLLRLDIGAMLFAPMNIDTVVIDAGKAQLAIVRRAVLSARAGVRKLELGTWAEDAEAHGG